jgi:hypothetical protein
MAGLCVANCSTGLEAPSGALRTVFAMEAPHVATPDGVVVEVVVGMIALWEMRALGDRIPGNRDLFFPTSGFEVPTPAPEKQCRDEVSVIERRPRFLCTVNAVAAEHVRGAARVFGGPVRVSAPHLTFKA